MSIYSIYRITNLLTGKVYIGFTSDPVRRWSKHCSCSKNSKFASLLYNSIRKHGLENFIFDVIYQSQDLTHTKNVMENYFIVEYDSYIGSKNHNGYNMTLGGDGGDTSHSPNFKRGIQQRYNGTWLLNVGRGKRGMKYGPQSKEHIQKRTSKRIGQTRINEMTTEQRLNMARPCSLNGHSKTWRFISPSGETFNVNGQFRQFCEDHNLEYSGMKKVASGNPAKKGKNLGWSMFQL